MNLIGNINAIPFRRFRGGGGVAPIPPFPSIPGMIARYSASGLTNEQMAANPVWVDKTGNGHDLQMKNFSWKGMSGVGGYVQDFNDFRNNATVDKIRIDEQGSNSIKVTILTTGIGNAIYIPKNIYQFNKSYSIKISSEGYNEGDLSLSFYASSVSTATTVKVPLNPNGITEIPAIKEDDFLAVYLNVGGKVGSITIEQLPLYPDALVFDGVDDYGVCDNFPILTKEKGYTVVALRRFIYDGVDRQYALMTNADPNGIKDGFILELVSPNRNKYADSFGSNTILSGFEKSVFTYQTSKYYNGAPIKIGEKLAFDKIAVGTRFYPNYDPANVAIWEICILDHDATEEELQKIQDYYKQEYPWLFPDQAWTVTGKTNEDEDRATIANITGNGNDLVLSNFGFIEGSGYGLYKTPFELYPSVQHSSKYSLSFSKFALGDHNLIITPKQNDLSYDIKVKVTGLKDGVKFKWGWIGTTGYIDITTDGIHMLNKPASQIRQLIVEFAEDFDPDHVVTIEQIPEYEGYLVTDGVDDKAVSKQFKFGENFTVILDFKFPVKKISYCGFDLSSKVRIQNLQGSGVYVVLKGNKTLIPSNVVRAVTSEGKVYDENWNEYNIVPGNISSNYTMVNLGFDGSNQFAESATKLAGIYSSALSKDDCIKAYNYLQTLKSK